LAPVRTGGALLLVAYAALAGRRALRGGHHGTPVVAGASSRSSVIAAALASTWLNPAVYLDTVVLLGSVAGTHPATRWWFGAGAASASVTWFVGLALGARLIGPALRRPQGQRALNGFVAVVMVVTAARTITG
jgi:L-lysine exporter family protein LysE/ArgO